MSYVFFCIRRFHYETIVAVVESVDQRLHLLSGRLVADHSSLVGK